MGSNRPAACDSCDVVDVARSSAAVARSVTGRPLMSRTNIMPDDRGLCPPECEVCKSKAAPASASVIVHSRKAAGKGGRQPYSSRNRRYHLTQSNAIRQGQAAAAAAAVVAAEAAAMPPPPTPTPPPEIPEPQASHSTLSTAQRINVVLNSLSELRERDSMSEAVCFSSRKILSLGSPPENRPLSHFSHSSRPSSPTTQSTLCPPPCTPSEQDSEPCTTATTSQRSTSPTAFAARRCSAWVMHPRTAHTVARVSCMQRSSCTFLCGNSSNVFCAAICGTFHISERGH